MMNPVTEARYRSVGELVRERRKLLGLGQKDLSAALGIDQTRVSQIENNAKDGYIPPRHIVLKLAEVLLCPARDLVRAAGYLDDEAEMWDDVGEMRAKQYEARRKLIEAERLIHEALAEFDTPAPAEPEQPTDIQRARGSRQRKQASEEQDIVIGSGDGG